MEYPTALRYDHRSGIDCLDPIDPVAGMDLAEMKQKYGNRIALKAMWIVRRP